MKQTMKMLAGLLIGSTMLSFVSKKEGTKILPKSILGKYAYVNEGKIITETGTESANSFYISKFEVSNQDYNEFLNALKQSGKTNLINQVNIDSTKWETGFHNKPFAQYYQHHPAFANYPVVNVSYEGAIQYCKWLTEKISKETNNEYILTFRLPTREEWIKAAEGEEQNLRYAWTGLYVRDNNGSFRANFNRIGDESIHYDFKENSYKIVLNSEAQTSKKSNDKSDVTAPVKSYFPNSIGLYNMNGNVAEMTSAKGIAVGGSWNSTGYDIRNQSIMTYNEASPEIGFRPILIITKK